MIRGRCLSRLTGRPGRLAFEEGSMTDRTEQPDSLASLNTCPRCGGPADNGHDRCVPPTAYYCKQCSAQRY